MSIFGAVGKSAWSSYKNNLNLGLLKKMMSSGYAKAGPSGGFYGAYTASRKWARGYGSKGRSTVGMFAARQGTIMAGGALAAGAIGGGLIGRHNMVDRNRNNYLSRTPGMMGGPRKKTLSTNI